MYAIIESGGKQYRVSEGDLIDLERFQGEIGEQVNFDRVLLVGDGKAAHLGTPLLTQGQVVGTIAAHGKLDKILVFKFKRRKGYRRKQGHRQQVTTVRIEKIALGGKATPQADSKPPAETPLKTAKKETPEKVQKVAAKKPPEKKTTTTTAKKKVSAKKAVKKKTAAAAKGKSSAPKKKASKKKPTKVAKKSTKKKD